jgi:hypothetical protein
MHRKRSRARHPGVRLKIKFSSFVKLPGASRKSESDSGAGGQKSEVLLREPARFWMKTAIPTLRF